MAAFAWSWLRFQPNSQLSHCFNQRFGPPAGGCGASVSWRSHGVSQSRCGAISNTGRFLLVQYSNHEISTWRASDYH